MTTVGYGDVFAVSTYGRLVSVINSIWGTFMISLFTTAMGGFIQLNDKEKRALAEITSAKKAGALVRAGI
jgi:hypothetical protein